MRRGEPRRQQEGLRGPDQEEGEARPPSPRTRSSQEATRPHRRRRAGSSSTRSSPPSPPTTRRWCGSRPRSCGGTRPSSTCPASSRRSSSRRSITSPCRTPPGRRRSKTTTSRRTGSSSPPPSTRVYPGHFLQGQWLKRAPTRVQKLLTSYSFTEGWAHYGEQMMIEEGFGAETPESHLGQLSDARPPQLSGGRLARRAHDEDDDGPGRAPLHRTTATRTRPPPASRPRAPRSTRGTSPTRWARSRSSRCATR